MAAVSRTLWFVAGAASGVYALVKVKRTAENFTPDGVGARVAAAKVGARMFADEVAAGMQEREADLLAELRAGAAPHRLIEQQTPKAPADTTALDAAPLHAAPLDGQERNLSTDGHR